METYQQHTSCIEDHFKKHYSNVYNQRAKHNPNKHCETWLLQLQGKETVNITTENFNKIIGLAKEWFHQNNASVELSCEIIRKWLKSLSLTVYNPHIPWLRKQIHYACDIQRYSNDSYDLSNDEIATILHHFNKIVVEFSHLTKEPGFFKMLEKKRIYNVLYCPYFFARILPFVIDDRTRLKILLSNIHFQSKTTLAKNDYIWKELCNRLNYVYRPLSSLVYNTC
jgi:hypothetical protein